MQLQDVEFHQHGGSFGDLGKIPCVANSRFTAEKYRSAFGLTPTVIHPFVVAGKYRTTTTKENVTMINPHPKTGRDIVLTIARLCSDIPFVFVESWPLTPDERRELLHKLAALPNATLLPACDDMRAVYGKARILLVPSV
jgi:hypothetical protein